MTTPPSLPSPPYLVGVAFLVVPDGITADGRLRLNVSLSPSLPAGPLSVDLLNWPKEVATVVASLKAALADIKGTVDQNGDARTVTTRASGISVVLTPPVPDEGALELWHRIFAVGAPTDPHALDGIGWLYAALQTQGVAPPPTAVASPRMATYQYSEIARRIDELYSAVAADALLRRAIRLSCMDAGTNIPPRFSISQLDVGAGWWRGLNRDWFDAEALEDPVSRLASLGAPGTTLQTSIDTEMANNWSAFNSAQWTVLLSQGILSRSNLSTPPPMFQTRMAATDYWTNGGPPDPTAGDLRTEMARLRASWGLDLAPADPKDPGRDWVTTPWEDAGRKLAAILSHPTLSKFLGFHVDLTLPADALGAATPAYGAIAVYAGDAPTQTPDTTSNYQWTAYVRREAPGVAGGYFGPCGREESALKKLQSTQLIVDGVLNLNAPIPGGRGPRFVIDSLNVDATCIALGQRSAQLAQAIRNGATPTRGSTALPDTPVPGIRLIDQNADTSAQQSAIRSRQLAANVAVDNATHLRDAEDLVEGYRVDCALATLDGQWRVANRWCSLTSKTVTYSSGTDIPARFLSDANVVALADREDGQVRAMVATRQGTSFLTGSPMALTAAQQTLFTWSGDSLALKARPDVDKKKDVGAPDDTKICDPAKDLAIDLDFDIPKSGAGRPPPLREQRAYMFGGRARFANGCGLSLEGALNAYLTQPASGPGLALGADQTTPFLFSRRAAILAPDVLLPWHSSIVTEDPKKWLGETVEHLVIRTYLGDHFSSITQRYLTPARARFELLEQAGVFDKTDEPAGAFTGDIGVAMDPQTGALPIATDGSWHFPKPAAPPGNGARLPTAKEVSRGAVLVLRANAGTPWAPYFVDPASRQVQARFVADGAEYGALRNPISFWDPDEAPEDAMPVLLELKRKYGTPGKRAIFDEDDGAEYVVPDQGILPVTVRKLTIALDVGESVDLEISAAVDPQKAAGHKYLKVGLELLRNQFAQVKQDVQTGQPNPQPIVPAAAETTRSALAGLASNVQAALVARLTDLLGPQSAKNLHALNELLRDAAVAPTVRKRIVRLIHAIDMPLKAPMFVPVAAGGPRIHAIVIKGAPGHGPTDSQAQWLTYVAAAQCQPVDQLAWPSEEQGATTFFVGAISIDRATTARVRCDANWLDYGTDTVRRNIDDTAWVKSPAVNGGTLFSVDDISFAGVLREASLDLLTDDTASLRSLFYAFKDGRARELSLRLIATSRFTDYFPASPGGCDRVGPNLDKPAPRIWVPCTFQPPAPTIDRVMPLFHWHVHRDRWHRKVTFSRTTSLRIYLMNDWWSSGQGEQLGLICATDDQALHSPFAAEVSRWGIDPTHISDTVSNALAWTQVSNPAARYDDKAVAPTIVHDVLVASEPQSTPPPFPDGDNAAIACPAPPPGPAPPSPETFSVVAFDPIFDPNDGLYCDVELDPGKSYWPFIEMHLVRYQAHAVSRFQVSPSTPFVTQIMPRRTGSATIMSSRRVAFEYAGYGYSKTNSTGGADADQQLANTPLLNVKLLMAYSEGDLPWDSHGHLEWQPVLDEHGQPVRLLRRTPRQAPDGEQTWDGELAAPRFDPEAHYGLLFEEVELTWIDDPAMTIDTCQTNPGPHILAERGPTLHNVVRLWRDDD